MNAQTPTTSGGEAGFKAWLYRPYIDLGPSGAGGNIHVTGVVLAQQAVEQRKSRPRLHGLLNPSVRKAVVREARLPGYDLDDPLELPRAMWTPGWAALCDAFAQFDDIAPDRRLDALFLLHRLCLHGAILRYAPPPTEAALGGSEAHAGIAYLRGLSYMAFANDGVATLDTAELERTAALAPEGGWARIEATYSLSAAAAKLQHDPVALARWCAEHRRQIDLAKVDDHTRAKLISRYHRMHAFVPQFAKDWAGMTAEMDLAESNADRMRRDTPETRAEWTVLTMAMSESRTKECLVLGDLARAEQWALRCVALCPADPRAWLEVGQVRIERQDLEGALAAYLRAARYGPPGSEVAWFMAGQCLEAMDEPDRAADAYLTALDLDPLSVSAAGRLAALTPDLGSPDLAAWADAKARALEALEAAVDAPTEQARPYQQYDGVLGRSV